VAAIALLRAAKRADSLTSLGQQLVIYIKDGRERDKFLSRALRLSAKFDQFAPSRLRQSLNGPTGQQGGPADPPAPAVRDAIETELTRYVGPIAKFLLRQHLRNFESLPKLYCGLAGYIADEAERATFLDSGNIGLDQP